jgi:hypothetical protein
VGTHFFSSKTSIHSKRLGRDGDERLKDQDGQDHIKLEPGTNPVMQGGRKNPTEKNKETPKKPLGVLSLLSSSSDQGVPIKAETNLGTGQKLEKTVPKGLGSATNLLKCAGS